MNKIKFLAAFVLFALPATASVAKSEEPVSTKAKEVKANWWCSASLDGDGGDCRRERKDCDKFAEDSAAIGQEHGRCLPASAAACFKVKDILTEKVYMDCSPSIKFCNAYRTSLIEFQKEDYKVLGKCKVTK